MTSIYRFDHLDQIFRVPDFLSPGTLNDLKAGRYQTRQKLDHLEPYVQRVRSEISHPGLDRELGQVMQTIELREAVAGWRDHAWRCVASSAIKSHEVFVSDYAPGEFFDWHVDHLIDHRILAWFIPLETIDEPWLKFTAGAMPINGFTRGQDREPRGPYRTERPVQNCLLVMPAWYPHRSLPLTVGRSLAHGHMIA